MSNSSRTPKRQCLGCGKKADKASFLRIVLTPEGIVADPDGKAAGRGAYLCKDPECLKKAVKRHAFSRSFHAEVDNDLTDAIGQYLES